MKDSRKGNTIDNDDTRTNDNDNDDNDDNDNESQGDISVDPSAITDRSGRNDYTESLLQEFQELAEICCLPTQKPTAEPNLVYSFPVQIGLFCFVFVFCFLLLFFVCLFVCVFVCLFVFKKKQ